MEYLLYQNVHRYGYSGKPLAKAGVTGQTGGPSLYRAYFRWNPTFICHEFHREALAER